MGAPDQDPRVQALVNRWDTFIAEVTASFDAVLQQALAQAEPIIAAVEVDLSTLTMPWTATKHQQHQHTERISDQWDEISDEFSEVLGDYDDEHEAAADAIMDRQGNKRDEANTELEIKYETAFRNVMARAAEVMKGRADSDDNIRRAFAASGAMYLGERAALPAWQTMTRAQTRINNYRNRKDVPLALLQEYEHAAREYWTTRLNVEAEHVPEQQKYVAGKLEAYLKDAFKILRQHRQWKNAQS